MTPADSPPPADALTRRQLRERRSASAAAALRLPAEEDAASGSSADAASATDPDGATGAEALFGISASDDEAPAAEDVVLPWVEESSVQATPVVQWAGQDHAPTALAWVSPERLSSASDDSELDGYAPSLLSGAPRRSSWRPAVAVPLLALGGLVAAYAATMILWPLHEVAPTASTAEVAPVSSQPAETLWSETGSGAVGIRGIGMTASAADAVPIASITKVVSALMVLDRMPLSPGESGPSYQFTRSDSNAYWSYLRRNESALDVPAGGELTQYQLLQGTLMGSANNYINRLVREIWGSNGNFAAAAEEWLADRDLSGITIVEPTGIDRANAADPASLIRLAEVAMANPVIREIVGTPVTNIPGAGEVVNSNPLLGSPGVTGVKTGSLTEQRSGMGVPYSNLLATKEIVVGETTVLISIAVLGQPDNDARVLEAESLFSQVETQLGAPGAAVPAGTTVGSVQTLWGETVDIVTDQATRVILWNGAGATNRVALDLGDSRDEGDPVGTLTTTGALDTSTTTVSLSAPIAGPSIWWRLTHPMELLGLDE